MKKMLVMLLIAALALTGAALAEATAVDKAVVDRFTDTWVDTGAAMEIWYDGDDAGFHCSAVLGNGGDVSDTFEYATCYYDADSAALICEDGTRTHDDHGQKTVTEGLSATVSFADGEDKLVWIDSEGLACDFLLQRLSDAEAEEYAEAQAFVGRWGCGRATIDITDNQDGSYAVEITWGSSAWECAEWHYACTYDGETKKMHTYEPGTMAVVTYDEGGEIASTATRYEDGEAAFYIDEDGMLIWEDAKENAGEDMRFERGISPDELDAEAAGEANP